MKFITGTELSESIYDIIYNAKRELIIFSPFIKLDDYFKNKVFDNLIDGKNDLHIIIAFGKNQDDIKKSLKESDLAYFKQFSNISIVYIPELHGKYYGNEKRAITTSINLYDYSFDNNIEFGIIFEKNILKPNNLFSQSLQECYNIIENHGDVIFANRPIFNKKIIGKDFCGVKKVISFKFPSKPFNKLSEIPKEIFENRNQINTIREKKEILKGHCIRCNKKIKLDLSIDLLSNTPMCSDCLSNWEKEGKEPYSKEKYCIDCGTKDKDIKYVIPACHTCFMKKHK